MDNEVRLIDANKLYSKSYLTRPATVDDPYGGESVVNLKDIELAPTIDPQSLIPTGKWVDEKWDTQWQSMTATCSHCRIRGEVRYNYNAYGLRVIDSPRCPNCGARMKE